MRRSRYAVLLYACLGLVACDRGASSDSKEFDEAPLQAAEPAPQAATDPPRIPSTSSDFSPSMARLAEGEEYDAHSYSDTETCGECHGEIARQWQDSAHALSSLNNPFYRVAFDEFFETQGEERSNFCAGCHDLAPMFAGELSAALDPEDPQGHIGITCTGCHGVVSTTPDGNASYALSTAPAALPKEGDPESLALHRAATGGPLAQGDALCASCHRAFLAPDTGHAVAIAGINDVSPWRRSIYAGNQTTRIDDDITPQGCIDCHMPPGPDGRRSHRFAGGHSTLAQAIGSEEQLAAVRAMVEGAAGVDIAALGQGGFAPGRELAGLRPGESLWFDVVVFNERVGHDFPGGARDLRDTYLEVVLRDGTGEVLAASGLDHGDSGEEDSVHQLKVLLASLDGQQVENHMVHQFRTAVFNHTIAPRDAATIRFAWDIPDEPLAEPVRIDIRLLHRRLHKALADQACEDAQEPRGQAFIEATARYSGVDMDPCREQPLLEVATTSILIGSDSALETPTWRSAFEHGLGLRHSLQEDLGEARLAFEHALSLHEDLAPTATSSNERAQILFMLGEVAARQGRTDQAMQRFEKAEELVGEHPAIDHARGRALIRVFHHRDALPFLDDPLDDRTALLYARAAASNFDYFTAYQAARMGLAWEPRDPDLLRVQSLAVGHLDAPQEWIEQARRAFLEFRHDEGASAVRARCSDSDEECLLERRPVHTHQLHR